MFFPLLHDLPFVEGVSFSLTEVPSVDFDLRVLGRADLMGVPALSQWLHSLIFGQAIEGMLWYVFRGARCCTFAAYTPAATGQACTPSIL